jgi:hypothetical protein
LWPTYVDAGTHGRGKRLNRTASKSTSSADCGRSAKAKHRSGDATDNSAYASANAA